MPYSRVLIRRKQLSAAATLLDLLRIYTCRISLAVLFLMFSIFWLIRSVIDPTDTHSIYFRLRSFASNVCCYLKAKPRRLSFR